MRSHPATRPAAPRALRPRTATGLRILLSTLCLLALTLALISPASAQLYQGRKLVEATLLADTTAIVPGQAFRLGLHLRMASGWHTYWENPGDSGLPTTFDPQLPDDFTSGPIIWPLPKRIIEPGDIQVYAYKGEVLLVRTITPPAGIDAPEIAIPAKSTWLVCEAICIPGKADLRLTLPVAPTAQPANTELFEKFAALAPSDDAPPFTTSWTATPTGWNLGLRDIGGDATRADFYPYADETAPVAPTAPRELTNGAADLAIPVAASAPVRGLVILENGDRRGWIIESTAATPAVAPPASTAPSGLWTYLLFGFIGGFILNLMPCVLPVISLKIFGFMRQAGDSRASILQHGLAFVAGIFLWFLGLAVVIIALKAAGSEVTWAFQFQNPWFNYVIGAVIFVFALNLFGVFEIVLPGRATQGIAEAGSHGGVAGSFAQGILATLLATPCTAPFLGTALGFAFSQTPAVIAAMFASIAAGMGFPYLLLSAQPGWMKFLPKPGAWMERLKQFMGFPLLATLLWLLYVIGQQRGTAAVIWAAAAYLCLGLAAWLYGAFLGPLSSTRVKWFATAAIALSLWLGLGYFTGNLFARAAATMPEKSGAAATDGIPWVPYSEAELQRLLAAGQPVFLDFTADWCITCKFNMRTAIDTEAVREAFAKLGIVPMLADWTNSNPEITRKLAQFDRVGVPFYLFYSAGTTDTPVILPELLTEQIILRAIGAQP
jgi:thiol:disulfide interchange protein